MILKKDCGCKILIKGSGGLSTIEYVKTVKFCSSHINRKSSKDFWESIKRSQDE